MKMLLGLLVFFVFITVRGQTFEDSLGTRQVSKSVGAYNTKTSDRFPVQSGISGIALDTSATVTNTPTLLSTLIGVYRINMIYLYNNTAGSTIWISADDDPATNGIPIEEASAWVDGIGYFLKTSDIWVVTSSGTANLRIKLKYKNYN